MVLAVLRGIVIACALAMALGVVVIVCTTAFGWPSDGGTEARARHVGEGISNGFLATTIAMTVAVPAAVVRSVRRRRRER